MEHLLLFVPFLIVFVHGGPQGLAPNLLAKIDTMPFLLKVPASTLNRNPTRKTIYKYENNNCKRFIFFVAVTIKYD